MMGRLINFFLFMGLMFCSFTLDAETSVELGKNVQRVYEGIQDMTFSFEQTTYIESLEKEINKTGKSQLKRQNKFKIEYTGPRGRIYLANGKKIWFYQPGDTQVSVVKMNRANLTPEALSFLGGLGNLTREFKIDNLDQKTFKQVLGLDSKLKWLKLTPLNPDTSFQEIWMGFEGKSYLTRQAVFFNKSGNRTQYFFRDIAFNSGIADEVFEFKEKGVKEINRNSID
ncbi:MAG: outer membrane lipoprotein carrier protein LolA [Deltaproteobacteria bacterium]|nr:outer membrane lipoprotein carrier protein LolA [Deltaproteobacteria bacterium]